MTAEECSALPIGTTLWRGRFVLVNATLAIEPVTIRRMRHTGRVAPCKPSVVPDLDCEVDPEHCFRDELAAREHALAAAAHYLHTLNKAVRVENDRVIALQAIRKKKPGK